MRVIRTTCFVFFFTQVNFSYSQDYFNPMFLGKDVASLENLSYLAEGNTLTPGSYYLDLYVSDIFIKNVNVKFIENPQTKKVVPCFTKDIINLIVFNKPTAKDLNSEVHGDDTCVDINKYIAEFGYQVDLSNSALKLSIPQIYLASIRSTLAEQDDWDEGLTAYLMNYDFSGSESKNKHSNDYSSNYLNLTNRVNIGAWRLNGNVYWNQNKYGSKTYNETDTNNIYLSRGISSIRSNLLVGQSSLGSTLFDAIPYIGVTLATSNEMLPDSERGYSPPIRGIADSRSKLTIRQSGSIIYQTYVDPGPYDINDLNPVGSSGDYEVELTAADGHITRYTVPYSSLPNLLKSGNFNYAATVGQLDIKSAKRAKFAQASASVGLPLQTTVYAGSQLSSDYKSIGVGVGRDLGALGAISVDAVNAQADLNNGKSETGQSYRILYGKSFLETGINIQLTGYRYSTAGYYSFSEASYKRSRHYMNPLTGEFIDYNLDGRRKNTFQINVSQSLGDYGQLYVWGNTSTYWGGTKSKNIQAGWNKTFSELNNLMVSFNYNKYTYSGSTDDVLYLSLSMPLSGRTSNYTMYVSNSTNYNTSKDTYNNNTSLYGNALDNRLDYNIYQTMNKESKDNTTNLNANYKTDAATLKLGTAYSSQTTQVDYGVSGSVLLHNDGVVFAREANDTAILVEAKGAAGAKVNRSGDNITIGKDGYALIPYATPYHYNEVELDPMTYGYDFNVENKILKVAPTRGAIAKVSFDVRKGYNFLVSVKHQGKPIRFGTLAKNLEDKTVSIANDDGTVYLTGVKNNSKYRVSWDKGVTCDFTINYGDDFSPGVINKIATTCL